MPIWLALDFESTGLDFVKDRIIEVGAILWSTNQRKCLESQGFLVKSDVSVTPEITKITGITQSAVDRYGYEQDDSLQTVLNLMEQADAVIGHNVVRFDKRMLQSWADRNSAEVPEKLWIDTYQDLPNTEVGKLTLMAANAGFLNMFPHAALADCQTVLKLVEPYDIEKVVERAKSPMIGIQAHQDRNSNDKAKKLRFRWEPQRKIWWKMIKEMDLDEFAKSASFDISIIGKDIFEEIRDL